MVLHQTVLKDSLHCQITMTGIRWNFIQEDKSQLV